MPEAQRRHPALLTEHHREIQKEDGSEHFNELYFISFSCKGWFQIIYGLKTFAANKNI
jgi:hypothetical protein